MFNIDGQVYPCCYLVNNNYSKQGSNLNAQKVMVEYNKAKDEMNIFKNDIDTINKHPWWKLLEQSWEDSDITLHQCARWCSVKEKDKNG